MENLKIFYNALANDKGMQERAAALNEKYKGEVPRENTVKAELLSFAKAEGYEFTLDDYDAYSKQAKPVSDEIADKAAGGAYNKNNCFCAVGGGGKDPETGRTCVCVLGGGGRVDKNGNGLFCIAAGWIDALDEPGGGLIVR